MRLADRYGLGRCRRLFLLWRPPRPTRPTRPRHCAASAAYTAAAFGRDSRERPPGSRVVGQPDQLRAIRWQRWSRHVSAVSSGTAGLDATHGEATAPRVPGEPASTRSACRMPWPSQARDPASRTRSRPLRRGCRWTSPRRPPVERRIWSTAAARSSAAVALPEPDTSTPVPRARSEQPVPGSGAALADNRSGCATPFAARPYLGSGPGSCPRRPTSRRPPAPWPRRPRTRRQGVSRQILRKRGDRRPEQHPPAHREHVRQSIRRGDLAEVQASSTRGGKKSSVPMIARSWLTR